MSARRAPVGRAASEHSAVPPPVPRGPMGTPILLVSTVARSIAAARMPSALADAGFDVPLLELGGADPAPARGGTPASATA
jgi:hypothetical protein